MSNADVPPNEFASTAYSHPLSAYSNDETFPIVTSVFDRHFHRNISSVNSRILIRDKFLIDPGVKTRESKGSDTKLADVGRSQEALDLRARYCAGMTMEMEQDGPFCNLADRPPIRSDPKILEGVCKSKHRPDIMDIWDGHVTHVGVVYRLWKNYNERAQIISVGAYKWGEGGGEGAKGKGTYGSEKNGVNRFVPLDQKCVQYVAEKRRKIQSGSLAPFATPTLNLEGLVGSVNREVYLAGDIDDLLKENSFGSGTMYFDEMFKPINRICRAILMERLAPLRYAKCVNHFKQAIALLNFAGSDR